MQQVVIALRFYAPGTFQRAIGDYFGVSVFASRGFEGYCEAKTTNPVIPRELG